MTIPLEAHVREALATYLLTIADDELILGHRHSEWTGFAPDIESDVALSSIAQEEMGHAKLFYEQVCAIKGGDPDTLVFNRSPEAFRNAILTERANDDWGYSVVRLFLYDRADAVRLTHLAGSSVSSLAELAGALRREEKSHQLFGLQWLQGLTRTSVGKNRIQAGLDRAWAESIALFEPVDGYETLLSARVVKASLETQQDLWRRDVGPLLEDLGLRIASEGNGAGGRAGRHSEELRALLAEMTSVWRLDPSAKW
jgi:ring-1,2-phenylacetyl-CoA epoxidase subunit PaaC